MDQKLYSEIKLNNKKLQFVYNIIHMYISFCGLYLKTTYKSLPRECIFTFFYSSRKYINLPNGDNFTVKTGGR